MPAVDVHLTIAAIDFNDGRDEDDHVRADVLDVGGVVDGEAVGELHERGGRAGFRRVDGAGDVVDGHRGVDEGFGFGVIEVDLAGVAELGETRLVFGGVGQDFGIGDGGGDHLAAFFRVADGIDLDAWAGGLKQAEVFIDILGVGQEIGRAGDVAKHLGRCGDGL